MLDTLAVDLALLMFLLPAVVGVLVPAFILIAGMVVFYKRRRKNDGQAD